MKDMTLRRSIATAIIERCKHTSPDLSVCEHCIESAKLALRED